MHLKNEATGVEWEAVTDSYGSYRFNNLPVGGYVLTVSAEGFAAASLAGVAVALNRTSTVNVVLEVGRLVTEVEVTAAAAAIDTTTPTIGSSFDSRQAVFSPQRQLAARRCSTCRCRGGGVASSGGVGLGDGPSVGGQRPRNNNFMVEGSR